MRKVLLLTYHFPPSGAVAVYRMIALARFLPKFGWQPIVVAPPRVPWEPEDTSLLAQVPGDMPIERVPFASGFFGKLARYTLPEGHWLFKANGACKRMIRTHQPQAIITSSPPNCVHLLGMRLNRKHGLPWLADFRDPWITNRVGLGIHRWPRCERWLERKVMRRASLLIANTPLNQEGWSTAFPDVANKIVTITNGYDPDRFAPLANPTPPASTLQILHAGEIYYGRDPRPLLDSLQGLPAERVPVQIEFVGRMTQGDFDLPAEIERRGLQDRVKTTGQLLYAQAIERMLRADILLLLQTPEYKVGVPAKLFEYLGAGKPILALAEPDGDIAWVLRESKVLHRIAPPRDIECIKQALVELTREVQAGRPAAPDPNALQQFTRERMVQRFADCLDRCVSPPPVV